MLGAMTMGGVGVAPGSTIMTGTSSTTTTTEGAVGLPGEVRESKVTIKMSINSSNNIALLTDLTHSDRRYDDSFWIRIGRGRD